MSVREDEDRHKNCPSRNLGLGVAVAAIGVGVGAALYYFMNKRQENPNTGGSTTRDWTCEPDHTLDETEDFEQNTDNSFTTISEYSTTDTSMNDSNISSCRCNDISDDMYSTVSESDSNSTQTDSNLTQTDSFSDDSDIETESNNSMSTSDSDVNEWDITNSLAFPSYAPPSTRQFMKEYARNLISFRSSNRNNNSQLRRDDAFRKRSWSLEECSICFDVILRDQEVMSLPCTHHFHTKCILPWLQEQQTCPNCRKSVD